MLGIVMSYLYRLSMGVGEFLSQKKKRKNIKIEILQGKRKVRGLNSKSIILKNLHKYDLSQQKETCKRKLKAKNIPNTVYDLKLLFFF